MKISFSKFFPLIIGFMIWSFFLIQFPTIWAILTIVFAVHQIFKCQRKAVLIQKIFMKRTCNSTDIQTATLVKK
jgi:hypothetical protein